MRILSLTLENIKSYHQPTHIEFTSGLNAVCGKNGSGKTTVLEAIGCALFDYRPYSPLTSFVREGERGGTIRLRILAGDEREYEVVRKIGSPNQHYVVDVERDARLVDRGPEVLEWIRTRALGIEGNTELSALFKNAVGVPQGLMTADFLGTAASRKAIFDPLLRVEEYRRAFDELLATVNYVRDQTQVVNRDIARLEGETEGIPALQAKAKEQRERTGATAPRVNPLSESLRLVEQRRTELDELAATLATHSGELQGAEYDVKRFVELHAEAERLLRSARAAHDALMKSETGHTLFLQAEDSVRSLEDRRKDRDALAAQLNIVQARLDSTRTHIARLRVDIDRAKAATAAAAALAVGVQRQVELEQTQRELEAELRAGIDIENRQTDLQRDIAQLDGRQADGAKHLERARAAREAAGALPAAQAKVRELQRQLDALIPLEAEMRRVREEGKTAKDRAKTLTDDVRQRDELRRELTALQSPVKSLDSLQASLDQFRERRALLMATAQYRDVARTSLAQRMCPLLEVQCPVVTANPAALDRLRGKSDHYDAELADVETGLRSVTADLETARKATERTHELELKLAKLEDSETLLENARSALAGFLAQHQELKVKLEAGTAIQTNLSDATADYERLAKLKVEGELVPVLESQRVQDEETFSRLNEQAQALARRQAELEATRERVAVLAQELATLDDPRTRQAQELAVAGRLTELERERDGDRARENQDEANRVRLVEQLAPFRGLEDELRQGQSLLTTHRPAYETYIRSQAEAATVSQRERVEREAAAAVTTAHERRAALQVQLGELQDLYSAGEHTDVRLQVQNLGQDLAGETARLEQARTDLRASEDELARLAQKQQALERHRAEHDELGAVANAVSFIRTTINLAGPLVTETLLAQISQGANDIFAEIMDDHVIELRWDKDYEVVVQRGAEVRKFNQLSGGEQMSAALAVRLALLKEMSEVDFAFFDEPTQNMDGERRGNLATQISHIRGFDQLIVISHDDTFEHNTENLVRLHKVQEETQLDLN